MFTIKVVGHTRPFGKLPTKEIADKTLVDLGWQKSTINDAYYKNGLTAIITPYYEPLPLEALQTLKISLPK